MSKLEWLVLVGCVAVSCRLLTACGGRTDMVTEPLPQGCTIQKEYIRVQLCPRQALALVCSDVAQTNPAPGVCGGPDWTEGRQETGNAWCCTDNVFEEGTIQ